MKKVRRYQKTDRWFENRKKLINWKLREKVFHYHQDLELSVIQIANELKLSRQRIYAILKERDKLR